MRTPPALAPGARVALVAPAGPLHGDDELELAEGHARDLGWEPVPGEHAASRLGYLAGTDEQRAADLNAAIRDPHVDGIWCLRGGYGAMRILGAVDYEALATHPKAIVGYSDVTALHAAIGRRCGIVSYHGPNARIPLTPLSRDSLHRAVIAQRDPCGSAPEARVLLPGRATGPLVGGNLALLAALAGTGFAPDYEGAILVLEDVGEPTYRIDRMLVQLALSGALARIAGLACGQFTDGTPSHDVTARPLDDVLREAAAHAGVPAIAGIPLGHVDEQWTFPLGRRAELDADARTLHVLDD